MLIRGDKLNSDQRRQVLNAYLYRWTYENERRNEVYRNISKPTMPLQHDDQWLAEHAFHFTKDGKRLMANRKHAEPAYMANPASGPVDEAAAKELYLFITNDADLYRQQHTPIIKNLVMKIDRGIYDRVKAVKLFMYLCESGAKKYAKEYGGTWHQMFNKATRELAAKNFVADFEEEYKLGNYNSLHAKKYSGKEGMLKNPGEIKIRLVKFPANQAWGFLFGRDVNTATHIDIGGKKLFQSKPEAIAAAKAHGLRVDKNGTVRVLKNPVSRVTAMPKKIIAHALDRLNALYGRGDVVRIDWKNNKVYCKKQYGEDVVSFKVIGNTVYFRGHQMSINGGVGIHNPASKSADIYVTKEDKSWVVDYPAKQYTGRFKKESNVRSFLKPAISSGLSVSWAGNGSTKKNPARMTPSELKYQVEQAGHDSYFFTRSSMKFFGDRMSNYGVRDAGTAWELYRKRPVKHGLKNSTYFDKKTFKRVSREG